MRNKQAFTLIELIIIILVIVILATMGIPSYIKSKNHTMAKEAISNLKLIAAAERIYKMEDAGSAYKACADTAACNTDLKLMLNATNWTYKVDLASGVATATATNVGTTTCTYTNSSANWDAEPSKGAGACPSGML